LSQADTNMFCFSLIDSFFHVKHLNYLQYTFSLLVLHQKIKESGEMQRTYRTMRKIHGNKEVFHLLKKAKLFAEKAHDGQLRKNGNVPYITHPIRVAEKLKLVGASEELICAGYLHDTVEDTSVEIVDIQKTFGTRVADLVAAHTEDKSRS